MKKLITWIAPMLALAVASSPAFAGSKVNVKKGIVDGHYYKWIGEGKRFTICTNVSRERCVYLVNYLDWAYSAMSSQFDAGNRDRYEKKWETEFLKKGVKTGRKTKDGYDVVHFKGKSPKEVKGYSNKKKGQNIVYFPAAEGRKAKRLYFYDRCLTGRRCVIKYAANAAEAKRIINASPLSKTVGISDGKRAFFKPDYGVVLVDKSQVNQLPFFKTLDTAVHESCHYMFEFSSFTHPVWFNEGYCYYLKVGPDRKIRAGAPRLDFLKRIRKARKEKKFMTLDHLVNLTTQTFRKSGREGLYYAASWSLFSYLNSDASGKKKNFYEFYNRLRNGVEPTKAFSETFKIKDLERKWLAWCDFQLDRLLKKHVAYFDKNSDGKADVLHVYSNGYKRYIKIDGDFNGRPDYFEERYPNGKTKSIIKDKTGDGKGNFFNEFDKKGQIVKVMIDRNKDKKIDYYAYYENGKVAKIRLDQNKDGKIDQISYYKKGIKYEARLDTNHNGRIDQWLLFKNKVCVEARLDTNMNGKVNEWIYYSGKKVIKRLIDTNHDGKWDKKLNR